MSFGKVPLGRGGSGVNFWKCRQPVFTHFVWDDGETVLRAVVKNLVILLPNEERSACNPFGGLAKHICVGYSAFSTEINTLKS